MKIFKKLVLIIAGFTCAFCFGFFTKPKNVVTVSAASESVGETPDDADEQMPKTPNDTDGVDDTTFNDFLSWAEEQAGKYGYGDEFSAAIEAIKVAATEKQVTLSTILSAALSATVIAFIIFNRVKEKKWKKELSTMATRLNELVNGTNGLIDETTKAENEVEKTEKATEEIKTEVACLQKGVKSLVKAFMRFTDGTRLQGTKKEEVQADCMAALKALDEVASNEDNQE